MRCLVSSISFFSSACSAAGGFPTGWMRSREIGGRYVMVSGPELRMNRLSHRDSRLYVQYCTVPVALTLIIS
jgi:hypothetical protein